MQPSRAIRSICSSLELAKCTITVRWSVRGLAAMHSSTVSSTRSSPASPLTCTCSCQPASQYTLANARKVSGCIIHSP